MGQIQLISIQFWDFRTTRGSWSLITIQMALSEDYPATRLAQ